MAVILTKDSFINLLPREGWLYKYLVYTSGGEIPPRFNFFAGVFTLASVLQRRVFFEKDEKVFPVFYIMLISPPAVGKKSRAIAFSERVLNTMKKNKPRILPSKITTEELLNTLSIQEIHVGDEVVEISSSGVLMCTELVNLLGKQQYLTGLVNMLTELYDSPEQKTIGTIKHGDWKLKNVFVSLIGGITPKSLQKDVPSEVLDTGFLSRVLLVQAPEDWDTRVPRPGKRDPHLQLTLAKELEEYSMLRGEMKFESETEILYDEWYLHRKINLDYGYSEREPDHVLKLAMILELSQSKQFLIQKNTLFQAIQIFKLLNKECAEYVPRLRAEQSANRTEQVYKKLIELGGKDVSHSKLLTRVWYLLPGRGGEFNEIIQDLIEMERIMPERTEKGVFYSSTLNKLWDR